MSAYLTHTIDARAVTRALAGAGDAARVSVLARFRAAGGSLDRWAASDLEVMVAAIGREEAEIEARSPGRWTPARAGLRSLRRALASMGGRT